MSAHSVAHTAHTNALYVKAFNMQRASEETKGVDTDVTDDMQKW